MNYRNARISASPDDAVRLEIRHLDGANMPTFRPGFPARGPARVLLQSPDELRREHEAVQDGISGLEARSSWASARTSTPGAVSQEVVDGARALTGARYTIDDSSQGREFVTSGLTSDKRAGLTAGSDGWRLFDTSRTCQETPSPEDNRAEGSDPAARKPRRRNRAAARRGRTESGTGPCMRPRTRGIAPENRLGGREPDPWKDPIPPEMRAELRHGARGRRGPRKAPASPSVETETAAVVVPFAANVRFAAECDEPVWDETAEMAVSVARSALASWARPDRLRCARVVGDSMAPTIRDGDLVVLDAGRAEPLDGQVFVVRTGEGLVVKRLRRLDDGWELESDNPAYESRAVTGPRPNPRSGGVDGATVAGHKARSE